MHALGLVTWMGLNSSKMELVQSWRLHHLGPINRTLLVPITNFNHPITIRKVDICIMGLMWVLLKTRIETYTSAHVSCVLCRVMHKVWGFSNVLLQRLYSNFLCFNIQYFMFIGWDEEIINTLCWLW
jgi:hypothetical protein